MSKYDDFKSFLESSKEDAEFFFSGVFEDINDAIETASTLVNIDPTRRLLVISNTKKEEKLIFAKIFFNTYTKTNDFIERILSGQINDVKLKDIVLIDNRTGYITGDRSKLLETIMTVARHKNIVIIVVIANGEYESFGLRNAFHLHVYRKDETSFVDSDHKNFIANGMETWKQSKDDHNDR